MHRLPSMLVTAAWAALLVVGDGRLLPADEPPVVAQDARPGQADLDEAIEAKLAAKTIDDYARVLECCKRALAAGLDDEGRKFADELYTGTLVDRAGLLVDRIHQAGDRDPQWPQLRAFAMRDLEEIVGRDPELGQAHLMIARLQALPQGSRDRATASARRALELLGDDKLQQARAHVVLAAVAEDDAARREHFDAAVELAPRSAEIRQARGLARLAGNEFDGAREDLEAAVGDSGDNAALHVALGIACAMAEKLPEARHAFDRAVELAPQSTEPLLHRARLLAVEEQFEDAIADLDRAVEIDPDDSGVRLLRARIRVQAGDERGAVADLDAVLRQEPDNPGGLELRAVMATARRDFAAAIRDFRRLVAKRPDDVAVLAQLGMLYLAADQPRKAIERFTRALENDDENFTCRRGRSDALISIGDHEAALADLEVALTLKPDDTGVLNNLAWLLATSPDDDLRDGARAIALATKACEATGWQQAHMISTLAAGYAEQGDFENAKNHSRQAIEAGGVTDEIQAQLQSEFDSYEAGKPWRERQEVEDADIDDEAGAAGRPATTGAAEQSREARRPFDAD